MLLLHYDRPFVEHGPVPPHERSWRHPSELAADELAVLRADEVPRSTRTFALATGTLGLVAIAVFVLTMTPSRQGTPVAVNASTTAVASGAAITNADATIAGVRRPMADVVSTRHALATPIGRGDYAVVVRASVERSLDDTVRVLLPSGRVVSGQIVDKSSDTALIALSETEPGHDVAERRPHDHEVVTVLATPPITVALADLDDLTVAEGTAVIDDHGELIGLCARGSNGTKLLNIGVTDDEALEPGAAPTEGIEPADEAETGTSTVPDTDDTVSDSSTDVTDSSTDVTDANADAETTIATDHDQVARDD